MFSTSILLSTSLPKGCCAVFSTTSIDNSEGERKSQDYMALFFQLNRRWNTAGKSVMFRVVFQKKKSWVESFMVCACVFVCATRCCVCSEKYQIFLIDNWWPKIQDYIASSNPTFTHFYCHLFHFLHFLLLILSEKDFLMPVSSFELLQFFFFSDSPCVFSRPSAWISAVIQYTSHNVYQSGESSAET